MKYPVLSHSKCADLAQQMVSGKGPAIEPHVRWAGAGAEVDLSAIEDLAQEITDQARRWDNSDKDLFEGGASVHLFKVLEDVPPHVLDDRGFWRFLALRYFWRFIAWREEKPFADGNYFKYVSAATNTESVLPRMYVRAKSVGGKNHSDLTGAVPKGGDFWRSHIVRVRTGSAPAITRAFVRKQADERLMTDNLRAAAKHLNRLWTNVVLHLYGDSEAKALLKSIWGAYSK